MKKTPPAWSFQSRKNEMAQGLKEDPGHKKANSQNENNISKNLIKPLFRHSLKILSPGETQYQLKSDLNPKQRS